MQTQGVDGLVLWKDENVRYLTLLRAQLIAGKSTSLNGVLLPREGEPILLASGGDVDKARFGMSWIGTIHAVPILEQPQLVDGERPSTSVVRIVLLVVSIAVMHWLAAAKRPTAEELHSHALEVDAGQTQICWELSIVALAGLALNAAFGWWWADPVAALSLALLITREGW